jgi:hypothetical protein
MENIMGNLPLEQNLYLHPLKTWMDNKNFETLFDILRRSKDFGCWIGWSLGESPPHLNALALNSLVALKGYAPWDLSVKDQMGWGDFDYRVRDRYMHQLTSLLLHQRSLSGNKFGIVMV